MSFKSQKNIETDLASFIHQAVLNPHSTKEELQKSCNIATYFNFSGFCTNPIRLRSARKMIPLKSDTKLISLISFPFGTVPSHIKTNEAQWSAEQGADELDLVPNYLALQEGKINSFAEEISEICEIGIPVCVILDINNLTGNLLETAIEASLDAGVNGIQTGNGFGASINTSDVRKLKSIAKNRCAIKAVGGIKELEHALNLIKEGATYIGTTNGNEIMNALLKKQQ